MRLHSNARGVSYRAVSGISDLWNLDLTNREERRKPMLGEILDGRLRGRGKTRGNKCSRFRTHSGTKGGRLISPMQMKKTIKKQTNRLAAGNAMINKQA